MKVATNFILSALNAHSGLKEKFKGNIWDRNAIPENPKTPYMFLFLVSSSEATQLLNKHTPIFSEEYQLSIVCNSREFGETTQTEIVKFINDEIELSEDIYDIYVIDLVPSEPRDNQGLLQYSVRIKILSKIY